MPADLRDVDPRELRVLPSRSAGARPDQTRAADCQVWLSTKGMPPLWVCEGTDGVLVIYNGVTRATRIAKLAPGTLVTVEVIAKLRRALAKEPKIGDLLP